MKKPLKIALYALLALVLIVLAYVIYVFAAYYRVEDYQSLDVVRTTCESPVPMGDAAETDVTYRISSANVGFGAYSNDYSFFMDGGKESRARSAEAVDENMRGEASLVKALSPDFALFQEVDIDGTRSWHVPEDAYLRDAMAGREIRRDQFTVSGCMSRIARKLRGGRFAFSELFDDRMSRAEVITMFMALLEMAKLNRLHVEQEAAYEEIYLSPYVPQKEE